MSQFKSRPNTPTNGVPISPTLTQDSRPVDQELRGSGTVADPYVVDWTGDNDEDNPYNWKASYRYTLAFLIGVSAFCVTYASSAYTGGLNGIVRDLDTSLDIALLGLALYVLGFGLGPLVWGPLSEVYGRRPIFFASYIPFACFHLGSALAPSVPAMMVFRLLAGSFGASVFSVPAGIIGELFRPHERGPVGLLVLAVSPLIGPVFGPIGGGFISGSGHKGWRWNFWAMFIFAVVTLAGMSFVPETFAPVLLRRRAERLQKESEGRLHYVSKFDLHGKKKPSTTLKIALSRPFAMLIHEPIVLVLTIYIALIYGVLYGLFASFPIIFGSHRHWTPGQSGLAFLGVGVGICISIGMAPVFNRRYMRIAQAGTVQPEERLVMCCVGAILLPVSLIWFAW
ncbi:major facilitator superfamily transporter [Ceratobasidium sp. AG-Ba]|nr:major facilitator superfamily transporter [Ceratobasidium sp. AG-Ba]